MNEQFRRNLISIVLIVLIISLIVSVYFIIQHEKTEGAKCINYPIKWTCEHTKFIRNGIYEGMPRTINCEEFFNDSILLSKIN